MDREVIQCAHRDAVSIGSIAQILKLISRRVSKIESGLNSDLELEGIIDAIGDYEGYMNASGNLGALTANEMQVAQTISNAVDASKVLADVLIKQCEYIDKLMSSTTNMDSKFAKYLQLVRRLFVETQKLASHIVVCLE